MSVANPIAKATAFLDDAADFPNPRLFFMMYGVIYIAIEMMVSSDVDLDSMIAIDSNIYAAKAWMLLGVNHQCNAKMA